MELASSKPAEKHSFITRDFILICASNFFLFLGFQMTLPMLPYFIRDIGGSDQIVGIIVGFFTFSALFTRSFAGQAVETRGRKLVYVLGLSFFVISIGSYAFLSSLYLVFFVRLLQGIGWGCSGTASGTIASDLIPASRRGEGMGIYALGANVALAIGPALSLTLMQKLSFHWMFLICASSGLISVFLSLLIRYKKVDKSTQKANEKHHFFEKAVWKPSLLMFLITITFGGIASFLPRHAEQQGIDISQVKYYFVVYALALMSTRLFMGKLYDRKGMKYVFPPGAIMIFLGMLLLAWLPNMTVLLIAAVLYGWGFGALQPAFNAWAISLVPENKRGAATATFFSSFDLGVGIGAILFGQISHLFGYPMIYILSASSIVIAFIIFFRFAKSGAFSKPSTTH
ncbi:MAG: major facilitator superfamily 1 [Bacillales bacterium]|jgi:MFS family permease|nr:major facilitator superfamily 1 [Bacillales bacterium]